MAKPCVCPYMHTSSHKHELVLMLTHTYLHTFAHAHRCVHTYTHTQLAFKDELEGGRVEGIGKDRESEPLASDSVPLE